MFCPNREKSNFSLPICLMLRITLQNAFGDTLHNIRDKMIRRSVKQKFTSNISHQNHCPLCPQKKIIYCKETRKCHIKRPSKYEGFLVVLFVCYSPNHLSDLVWIFVLYSFCCSTTAKPSYSPPFKRWRRSRVCLLHSPSLNIFVALAKILVSYALGIGAGALVQSQIMGQGLPEPHSAHLMSLNRTIPMLMLPRPSIFAGREGTQLHWGIIFEQVWYVAEWEKSLVVLQCRWWIFLRKKSCKIAGKKEK